jgi:hypothetical protein
MGNTLYTLLWGGEKATVFSNWALAVVSLHLAHRTLPEEKKHWIRDKAKVVRQVRRIRRPRR